MCGRYRLSRRKQIIEEHFDCDSWDYDWNPRFNISPTQLVPVIRQRLKETARQISLMRWGLIPHSAKDFSITTSTINAKSEQPRRSLRSAIRSGFAGAQGFNTLTLHFINTCAVKRRWTTAGESPARELGSLHPEAIRAAVEETKPSEPLV